jgi:hypothetical protein
MFHSTNSKTIFRSLNSPLLYWLQLMFNPDWLVVAGEESEESALQNERVFGALEAIYPRLSNIPLK